MAEAAALAGAGWVASPIVSRLLSEGFSYLGDTSIKDRLENLETTILPQFQLEIEAAERSKHKTKLKLWLRKLKNAIYEAEEMLDLYQYELPEQKVNLLSHPTPNLFTKFVGNLKKGLPSTFSPQKKLRDNLIKLESTAAEANTEYCTANDTTSRSQPKVTTTSLPPPKVFGRNEERDEIIDKHLLDPRKACRSEMGTIRSRSYLVVAIVGIGGFGKTTLVQFFYKDQRLVSNFDIKIWDNMSLASSTSLGSQGR
ncbi:putative disease resistance protein RGA3 [Typha latifolia]|uniref:putative disease resistance protein RGA3 n=1 Tax=Typha latifolia TaxID=4733 RepID=UPI003C2DCF1C